MMSVLDLKFLDESLSVVYDYLTANSDEDAVTVKVQNLGEKELKNLGVYLTVASTVGDVDNPPDYTPASSLQTIIDWGQNTVKGVTPVGGLKIVYSDPTDNSEVTKYFSRSDGSSYRNKIKVGYSLAEEGYRNILPPGGIITFQLSLETPPSVVAKRLFVNIGVG